ncbi:MAG: hypothetical protein U1E84_03810 [Rhodoferax sp.]
MTRPTVFCAGGGAAGADALGLALADVVLTVGPLDWPQATSAAAAMESKPSLTYFIGRISSW